MKLETSLKCFHRKSLPVFCSLENFTSTRRVDRLCISGLILFTAGRLSVKTNGARPLRRPESHAEDGWSRCSVYAIRSLTMPNLPTCRMTSKDLIIPYHNKKISSVCNVFENYVCINNLWYTHGIFIYSFSCLVVYAVLRLFSLYYGGKRPGKALVKRTIIHKLLLGLPTIRGTSMI